MEVTQPSSLDLPSLAKRVRKALCRSVVQLAGPPALIGAFAIPDAPLGQLDDALGEARRVSGRPSRNATSALAAARALTMSSRWTPATTASMSTRSTGAAAWAADGARDSTNAWPTPSSTPGPSCRFAVRRASSCSKFRVLAPSCSVLPALGSGTARCCVYEGARLRGPSRRRPHRDRISRGYVGLHPKVASGRCIPCALRGPVAFGA